MSRATATAEPPETAPRLRQARSLYLPPEQFRQIDDACFDLAAASREKKSFSRVMERFIGKHFAKFVAEEIEEARPARRKRTEKLGDDEGRR